MITITLLLIFTTKCSCMSLQQITQPVDHGEGPVWDSRTGLLYFVDIHAGNVHSYDPETLELRSIHFHGDVTPVIPSKVHPQQLLVGVNRTLFAVNWDGKSEFYRSKPLTTVSKQFTSSRFNDGKADKQGRLWIGTIGFEDATGVAPNEGVLYKITKSNLKNPSVMLAPVNVSNGLAWNKQNNKFYYIDTPTRKIFEYDYDDKTGSIKNGRTAFDLGFYNNSVRGFPDGMAIDKDDNLWIALYNGGAVIKVDPRHGFLLQIISIPAEAVTSVAWGGFNLDILYITTSRYRLTPEQRKLQPYAGSVFALTDTGTTGTQTYEAAIVGKI